MTRTSSHNLIKTKKRVSDHGEVFTADREVNAMLDLVKQETERIDARFLEPACGNGNFLAEILRRKLEVVASRYKKNQSEYERNSVIAVGSIYGIDLLPDNISECIHRLFGIWDTQYTQFYKNKCSDACRESIRFVLSKNIILGDALTLKTVDGTDTSITFSEWSPVNGTMIKRRDYFMGWLVDLFSDNATNERQSNLFSDLGNPVRIADYKDYPLSHYLKLDTYAF